MYFLGWMLSGGLMMMRDDFYREYFLDKFDMMIDQTYAIAVYPRLTFGQNQRYASKGCYIIQAGPGDSPRLIERGEWIVH
jgi:hypothetical protein